MQRRIRCYLEERNLKVSLEKSDVNQINKYYRTPTIPNAKTKSWFRCGRDTYLANDDKCPANGAQCRK